MIVTVVVGYNSKKDLDACFSSLFTADKTCQIIFVDNASSDGSVAYVTQHYPKVTVLTQTENLGFAQANNIGIAAAKKQGATHIFFLNPDAHIAEDFFQQLATPLKTGAVIQPLILLTDTTKDEKATDLVNTSGGELHYLGQSYCSDYRKSAQTVKARDTLLIGSGAAIIIPVAILNEVGDFDGQFFMYHEDVDLTWRIRRAGYTIQLVPHLRVWHQYSFSRNPRKFYYAERNRLIFLLKNFEASYLWLISPMLIINELAGILYLALQGMPLVKLSGYGYILGHWPQLMRQRAIIAKDRRAPLAALTKQMVSELSFSEVDVPAIDIYNTIVRSYWKLIQPR